jgi:penicillin amidase
MKTIRFIITIVITLALGISLNSKIGGIPPLGKFLSPFQGFWQNAEKEGVNYEEEIKIEGLKSKVTVYYDEMRIPHIYADNNLDLHMVQGYLTARDRLWQMDFFSRVVMGRISEVVGERALSLDRLNRRIGLKKMTIDTWEGVQKDKELKAIVEAYSAGVNMYIDNIGYDEYPLEFKLLNYAPEEWSPMKSCLAYAMLNNTLSRSDQDLENTNMLALFGREVFDILFPDQLGNLDPVIRKDKKWDFAPITTTKPAINLPSFGTKTVIEKQNPLNGSNNFAVSGSKSASGNPLFANEPDLELTQPSIWYANHLHSPTKNVMGVTVPGTPIILIGFNENISFGVTNSPRDQVDWYSIDFRSHDRKEYYYNNQWFKSETVVEKISIAGTEAFYDTIVYTHHGPVVYDNNFLPENDTKNYAMKWIAHYPSQTFNAMLELNTADNYEDYMQAMRKFQGPPQNILFASNQGDIAITLPGKFPVKWPEQGKFLMDGSNPKHEWTDYIPFEHYLKDKNPEQGFLSSANQHPTSKNYPYYVYDHHYEYYRGRRINERLRELNSITPRDMMALQNDNYNYVASESLPMMLDALDTVSLTSDQRKQYDLLKKWDYFSSPTDETSAQYQLWWDELNGSLWDEFDTISVAVAKPNKYVTINYLKTDSSSTFTNVLNTNKKESSTDLIKMAFEKAVDSLAAWKTENGKLVEWYKFKNTTVKHILGLAPFSRDQIKIGGYNSIVNAASGAHGPSWRMVVELDPNGTKAWGVYPGSQTGNPGSPLYGHMIDRWASGNYYELLFGDNISSSDKIIFTQKMQPK